MAKRASRFNLVTILSIIFLFTETVRAEVSVCTSVTTIPKAECDALVDLYKSSNGVNWLRKDKWLTAADPCSWEDLKCSNGRVSHIYLYKNQLKGPIPASIGSLTKLQVLQVNENQLSGRIPKQLKSLKSLLWLRLEGNLLSGKIPGNLGNLKSLEYLYLSGNKLSKKIPKSLGKLKNLRRLYLGNNQLTGTLPSQLGALSNLEYLMLVGNNQLTGPFPLSFVNLKKLEYLHLQNTNICIPRNAALKQWISNIQFLYSNAVDCTSIPGRTVRPTPKATIPAKPSTAPPKPSTAPPPAGFVNYCQGVKITDNRKMRIPPRRKPAYLSSYTDPAFGVKVTRITQSAFNDVRKTMYNTIQAWNADESLLILYHTNAAGNAAGHHLYNGKNYRYIRKLSFSPTDIEQVFWHPKNKNVFLYVNRVSPNRGHLLRYDVRNNQKTSIKNFARVCGTTVPTGGNNVQMMSWDGDLIGLRCNSKTFSYRISTDKSVAINIGDGTNLSPYLAAQSAPSGKLLLVGGKVLNQNMQVVRTIDFGKTEHSCFGRTPNGNDGYFAVNFGVQPNGCNGDPNRGVGTLVSYDLKTGTCNNIINEQKGYGYPLSGIHHSGLNRKANGWVAVSAIGYSNQMSFLSNNQPAPVLVSEIFLAYADPKNPIVCRLAHHRTYARYKTTGGYNGYFGEPHPVLSPSGTRILFSSDWGNSGSVDTYVIELPIHK